MKRPWHAWTAFFVCGAALAAALAWLSVRALALDRSEAEARALAQVEENCRLALWRLDSRMAAILVRESAQPASAYAAFTEVVSNDTVEGSGAGVQDEGVQGGGRSHERTRGRAARLVPSPLLVDTPAEVRLHVEFDARGTARSPQVPDGDRRARAVPRYLSEAQAAACAARLAEARRLVEPVELARRAAGPGSASEVLIAQQVVGDESQDVESEAELAGSAPRTPLTQSARSQSNRTQAARTQTARTNATGSGALADGLSQSARNNTEFEARQQLQFNQQIQFPQNATRPANGAVPSAAGPNAAVPSAAGPDVVGPGDGAVRPRESSEPAEPMDSGEPAMGPMAFVWIGEELMLARASVARGTDARGTDARTLGARTSDARRGPIVQVCWLDWPALKDELLEGIRDLLPTADLVALEAGPFDAAAAPPAAAPSSGEAGDSDGAGQGARSRRLATLPARLLAADAAVAATSLARSPIRVALAVLWFSGAAVFVGSAFLLRGVLTLSERRAAFVSAVTHELRTPLTTFQLYSEMLAEEMVPDPAARKSYLQTLRAEAARLSHLVENVLAYARLERGAGAGRLRDVPLVELVGGMVDRLRDRARASGMALEVDDRAAEGVVARTDPRAVEQILFNLVDNACKYGASESGVRVELDESAARPVIRVRDFGPGVAPDVRRKLFQPFRKSSEAAAESSPGVGLGLSLCRRLSRELGGELRWEDGVAPGACFALELRRGTSG